MKRVCKQCGSEFELSDSEISFYKSKGLELPKRCQSCRSQNHKHKGSRKNAVTIAAALFLLLAIFVIKNIFPASTRGELPPEDFVSAGSSLVEEQELADGVLWDVTDETFGAGQQTPELMQPESEAGQQPPMVAQPESETEQPQLEGEVTQSSEKSPEPVVSDGTQHSAETVSETIQEAPDIIAYEFRKARYLTEHFEKHGAEFPYMTEEEYLAGANSVIQNPEALHKLEAEDGDDVYYVEDTKEFVVVSTDGYIRTYFKADLDYYNRQ